MSNTICTFCFQGQDNPKPFCLDNPGFGCTYGFHHEWDNDVAKPKAKVQTVKKVDKQVCSKCKLHAKNPASATNGCEHEYA